MARKSKYVDNVVDNQTTNTEQNVVLTAIYARKSIEDDSSLEIQIAMLNDYINAQHDFVLYKIYSDNGFTGTNFERPGFKQMIEDMEAEKFTAVIVKDGSRLGRNYLEAGVYMENVFPAYNIRFISVNDHYDSEDLKCKRDTISIPLKNMMNEQYSKDLSRKLTSAFRTKQLSGEYIGAYAPYGYSKDTGNCNKLVIDEETAPVVRRLFQMKIDGISDCEIAKILNKESVLSPFAHRYEKGLVKADKYKGMPWKKGTIAQILVSPMYLGNMVQGRFKQSLSNREVQHKRPENEWIIVENTHEALVSKETFDEVLHIIKLRKEKYQINLEQAGNKYSYENLFKGKIFCSDCGRAMVLGINHIKSGTQYYYRCRLYGESKGTECKQRSIRKDRLEAVVLDTIMMHFKNYSDYGKAIREMNRTPEARVKKKEYLEKICTLEKEKARNVTLAAGLHSDYKESLLDKEEYQFATSQYNDRISNLDSQIEAYRNKNNLYSEEYGGSDKLNKNILKYCKVKKLNQEMVDQLINRIEIYQGGDVKIILNFKEIIDEQLSILIQRRNEIYGIAE